MDPYKFQEEINKLAPDIKLLWNPNNERFQIFQVNRSMDDFVLPAESITEARKNRIRHLFTIENEDGSYRPPAFEDLERIRFMVDMTHHLQIKGSEFVADEMERRDDEREAAVSPKVKDMFRTAAEDIHKIRVTRGIEGFK